MKYKWKHIRPCSWDPESVVILFASTAVGALLGNDYDKLFIRSTLLIPATLISTLSRRAKRHSLQQFSGNMGDIGMIADVHFIEDCDGSRAF